MPIHEFLLALAATPTPVPGDLGGGDVMTQPEATLRAGTIVGIGALLGFIASLLNQWVVHSSSKRTDAREREKADRDHEREVMSERQERYTTIAGQLASQHEPVRLAGAYALSALADEWQVVGSASQQKVSIELLCAYLRAQPRNDQETRAGIISIIKSHTLPNSEHPWQGTDINLKGASLIDADLTMANLSGSKLQKALMANASLLGADLKKAQLTEVMMPDALLIHADLSDANLQQAKLQRAFMLSCTLNGVNAGNIDLSNARLKGANIVKAFMASATVNHADLSETNLSQTDLTHSSGQNVNFEDAKLDGTIFESAGLSAANFKNADLRGANLRFAKMISASFEGAQLQEIEAELANLTNADLTRADLMGASLVQADLKYCNLSHANLSDVDLSRADLSGADVSGANLSGAKVEGTIWSTDGAPGEGSSFGAVKWSESTVWPSSEFDVHGLLS